MEEQLPTSFIELTALIVYLGSVTFLTGSIIFFWFIRRRALITTIISIALQLIVAIALSLFIWTVWPFKFDIMFGFLCLPALFSEVITLPVFAFFINQFIKRHK